MLRPRGGLAFGMVCEVTVPGRSGSSDGRDGWSLNTEKSRVLVALEPH